MPVYWLTACPMAGGVWSPLGIADGVGADEGEGVSDGAAGALVAGAAGLGAWPMTAWTPLSVGGSSVRIAWKVTATPTAATMSDTPSPTAIRHCCLVARLMNTPRDDLTLVGPRRDQA